MAQNTLTLEYNNIRSVSEAFAKLGNEIAAVIVEPVAGNMNCIPPAEGFLPSLRELCTQFGALLIFDEVMTGFRVAAGGAQGLFDVRPDLTTLGKVIGGGLPIGAFGGRREVMAHLSPAGPVYQAGTLSGNPVTLAAGLATLQAVQQDGFFERLAAKTERLTTAISVAADRAGIAFSTNHIGGMFGLFFTDTSPVTCYHDVMQCDVERFKIFFHGMLQRGIYFAPSAFEAGFVSAAHSDADIETTVNAAADTFGDM